MRKAGTAVAARSLQALGLGVTLVGLAAGISLRSMELELVLLCLGCGSFLLGRRLAP
jgi:hypothetical protein